jgi:hypothetical protein
MDARRGRRPFVVRRVHPEDRDPLAGAMSWSAGRRGRVDDGGNPRAARRRSAIGRSRRWPSITSTIPRSAPLSSTLRDIHGAAAARGAAAAFAKDWRRSGQLAGGSVARLHEPADRHPRLLRAGAGRSPAGRIPCGTISRRFAPPASGRRR